MSLLSDYFQRWLLGQYFLPSMTLPLIKSCSLFPFSLNWSGQALQWVLTNIIWCVWWALIIYCFLIFFNILWTSFWVKSSIQHDLKWLHTVLLCLCCNFHSLGPPNITFKIPCIIISGILWRQILLAKSL